MKTARYAVPVFGAGYRRTVKTFRTLPRKLLCERQKRMKGNTENNLIEI
jgi:hypothetical protein